MENLIRHFTRKAVILCCIAAAAYAGSTQKTETTITGIIYIAGETDAGEVTSLTIEAENKGDVDFYHIVMNETGKELIDQVGNTVSVTGTVPQREDGKKLIRVKSYKVIKEADTESDTKKPAEPQQQQQEESVEDDEIK